MLEFSLSKKDKALPDTVLVSGSAFPVNADYRVILRILRMLDDDEVIERQKPSLIIDWFYLSKKRIVLPLSGRSFYIAVKQPTDYEAAIEAFRAFIRRGEDAPDDQDVGEPPVMDYEIDAPEIYASFVMLYGIDLNEVKFLHWWKFHALLDGAFYGSGPLAEKIKLRTLDPTKYENPELIRRAQDKVRIDKKLSRAERELQQRLYDVLSGGGDVSAGLEALKNGL
jgi:hypothetical protein